MYAHESCSLLLLRRFAQQLFLPFVKLKRLRLMLRQIPAEAREPTLNDILSFQVDPLRCSKGIEVSLSSTELKAQHRGK